MSELIEDGIWGALVWFSVLDVLMVGERITHGVVRAARRMRMRRYRRQALEVRPPTPRVFRRPRVWLRARAETVAPTPSARAPQTPVGAAHSRRAASTGLH